ncbi:MAG: hypothetical protein IJZ33_03770 [Clostridia bacterium]|nr:hypothetical protein [Clostridia bacterium]
MEIITTVAGVITALGVIFGVIFAIYKWYLKQEKQDKDIKAIKEEQFVLIYALCAERSFMITAANTGSIVRKTVIRIGRKGNERTGLL